MNNNSKIYKINDVFTLLDYYLLMIKKNNQSLIISKQEQNIIVFNNNLKITLSKNEFKNNFKDESFIIFKDLVENTEINMEYKKLRQ